MLVAYSNLWVGYSSLAYFMPKVNYSNYYFLSFIDSSYFNIDGNLSWPKVCFIFNLLKVCFCFIYIGSIICFEINEI